MEKTTGDPPNLQFAVYKGSGKNANFKEWLLERYSRSLLTTVSICSDLEYFGMFRWVLQNPSNLQKEFENPILAVKV